jgi:hypothetical protein
MPFSGGGGGQLTAHVHDNTPLQGGPLNFNNTTIAGMNAGDLTFSDGAALQTLTYPAIPAGESLTAVAASTAPSWVAAGGGVWEVLSDTVLGAAGPLTSGTFSAQDKFIKVLFYGASVGAVILGITCNNTNGATEYAYSSFRNYTTTTGGDLENEFGYLTGMSTSNPCFFEMTGYNGDSTDDKLFTISTNANTTTGNTRPTSYQSVGKWYGGAYITSFGIVGNNTGVHINMQAGSRMLVLAAPA